MKFMIMHKMTAELEKGRPPDAETLSRIQKLIGDAIEKKVFVSGEGLGPTAQRMHIVYKKGKRKVTQGPFKDARELGRPSGASSQRRAPRRATATFRLRA
jgi:hypothetical protein